MTFQSQREHSRNPLPPKRSRSSPAAFSTGVAGDWPAKGRRFRHKPTLRATWKDGWALLFLLFNVPVQSHSDDTEISVWPISLVLAQEESPNRQASEPRNLPHPESGGSSRARHPILQAPLTLASQLLQQNISLPGPVILPHHTVLKRPQGLAA